jgi:2-oxoglutarate dehydrogenase E2 component (dihydrolipoamide succinyltransferase)
MEDSIKITLPKLGESILSATIVQWFKEPGDRVERDEPLLEVSTDKVNSEIPSPAAGILQEILALPDQELEVGAPLALLAIKSSPAAVAAAFVATPSCAAEEEENTLLSPAVLRLLQEKKISLNDIAKIPHTGHGGRLTKQDVEGYCPLKTKNSIQQSDIERVKMTGLRKAIAENMVKSFYEAPHASLITEVDVTHLMRWIGEQKQQFLQENGTKLTITALAARAVCRALRVYPLINSSLEQDTIVMKKSVNLGIAVSIDQGVMVPVIRNCQSLSLPEIAKAISRLADKARNESLLPQEVQEGSITMTNFGMTGTMIGIPIIRYPEVAIVGLGAIVKKVAAMPDDSIAIRSMMMVSLTFDHRVLDGLYGCGFLNELKGNLEHTRCDTE